MRKQIFIALLATVQLVDMSLSARRADAQSPPPDPACASGAANGAPYLRCSLWLDGTKLRQGTDGTVIGKERFLLPMSLMHLVSGDSARAFAATYESKHHTGMIFAFVGGALTVTGLAMSNTECVQTSFGTCADRFSSQQWTGLAMLGAGLVSEIISFQFQLGSRRAAAKAVWWHNSAFAK